MAEIIVGRAAAAPPDRPARRDGSSRAGRRHARRARDRDRDQRDGRARSRCWPAASSTRPTTAEFWRTWWLGDTSGGLVVLPLMLAWAPDPVRRWRRIRDLGGRRHGRRASPRSALSRSRRDEPVTYMVFPALIWAAFRFGPPGATLSIAIAAGVAIGVTANDVGPFFKQPIDHRTLSTQLYICRRGAHDAVPERRGQRARAVRQGAGRGAQTRASGRWRSGTGSRATCTTPSPRRCSRRCCTRARPRRRSRRRASSPQGRVGRSLGAIGELTRSVQSEMRALIFELGRDPVARRARCRPRAARRRGSDAADGLSIDVRGPERPLAAVRSRWRRSCSPSGARRSPMS